MKKDYTFVRTGRFVMRGAVEIDIEDIEDEDKVKETLQNKDFSQFLATEIDWQDEEWTFEQART